MIESSKQETGDIMPIQFRKYKMYVHILNIYSYVLQENMQREFFNKTHLDYTY